MSATVAAAAPRLILKQIAVVEISRTADLGGISSGCDALDVTTDSGAGVCVGVAGSATNQRGPGTTFFAREPSECSRSGSSVADGKSVSLISVVMV